MRTRSLRFLGLTLGLLISSSFVAAQTHRQKPDACKDTSNMTQGQINECALKDLQKTELRMERLLKQLGIAPDSSEQKAWEAYRDSQLARALSTKGYFELRVCLSHVFIYLEENPHRRPDPRFESTHNIGRG